MQDDFLYQHMPDAEQRMNDAVKPLAHQPSKKYARRMERMFAEKKTNTDRKWLTAAAAVVMAVSLSVIPWQAQSVRGSDGMIHRFNSRTGTVLKLDASVQTLPDAMRILPQTIAGKYDDVVNTGEDREQEIQMSARRDYWYFSRGDEDSKNFVVTQDGLAGKRYYFDVDHQNWKRMVIDEYFVYYAVSSEYYNREFRGYSGYAYWYEDNCLVVIQGRLSELELLEVIEDLFRQKK